MIQLVAFGYGIVGLVICRVAQRCKVGRRLHDRLDLRVAVGVAYALVAGDNAILVAVAGCEHHLCAGAFIAAVNFVGSPTGYCCTKAGHSAVIGHIAFTVFFVIVIYAGDHALFKGIFFVIVAAGGNEHDLLSACRVAVKVADHD